MWVANNLDDTISRISPVTNKVTDLIQVGNGPSSIAVVRGIVWVANEADGTLSRIEPGQASVRTTVIGSTPQGLVSANGDVWVSVRGATTSHRGGTLRMLSLNRPFTFDPATSYDYYSWNLMHLLGDGLVAFEPIGGTNPTLEPDLAVSIPTATNGDRTYAFELRPGLTYSDGGAVAPADFRRAFERGFRLDTNDHTNLFGDLVGGETCGAQPRTCDLSRGIVTDDANESITFHLVRPDPEFLYKLTEPFAYPVPPSVPAEEQRNAGVPGTGPYMLEGPMTEEGVVLIRNPQFQVWSAAAQPDGYVDRIEVTFGIQPDAQVDAVSAGDADLAFDAYLSDRIDELVVRFAAQVHATPQALTAFVVLNTRQPPFNDIDARRAVNFAVDRARVVQILGGEGAWRVTCQQLPPNFPGYEPYCPYTSPAPLGTWTAPDFKKAERLVRRSGTAGSKVEFTYPRWLDPRGGLGGYLIELLHRLGYSASVRIVPGGIYNSPGNEFDMALDAWSADYPAASSFITNRFTCDASWNPSAGFCDPRVDAMVDRATRMQAVDPAATGALWAKIDRTIVDQAPYVWLANGIALDFVSARVSNYQWSPQWAALLDQLWVR